MQNIYASNTTFHPAMMPPGNMRLNWLLFENRVTAEQRSRFRHPAHELEREMMRRPLTPQTIYQWFGLMLGLAASAAIFVRVLHYGLGGFGFGYEWSTGLFFLCLTTNVVCALLGFLMGGVFSNSALSAIRASRSKMVARLALIGMGWGAATGGFGGLCFFGVGAFFGMLCAVPISILAFVLFGMLHRWLERGGAIEARHFWPLATGIVGTIAALILAL